jgi:hypothetical protein
MIFHRGDRVMVYTNLGKLGKGTVKEPPPTIVMNNDLPDYMTVLMDEGSTLFVKSTICRKLRKKASVNSD